MKVNFFWQDEGQGSHNMSFWLGYAFFEWFPSDVQILGRSVMANASLLLSSSWPSGYPQKSSPCLTSVLVQTLEMILYTVQFVFHSWRGLVANVHVSSRLAVNLHIFKGYTQLGDVHKWSVGVCPVFVILDCQVSLWSFEPAGSAQYLLPCSSCTSTALVAQSFLKEQYSSVIATFQFYFWLSKQHVSLLTKSPPNTYCLELKQPCIL